MGLCKCPLAVALAVTLAMSFSAQSAVASTEERFDVAPSRELAGSVAQLSDPSGVALDEAGRLYVANRSSNSVTVYAPDWSTSRNSPVKVLKGQATQLSQPRAIAFDSLGRMYVVNTDSVTVYESNWTSGDAAPVKVMRGPNAALVDPRGIAFDPSDRMYVVNSYEHASYGSSERVGSITVYSPNWASGDVSPEATLQGPQTYLDRPYAVAFDYLGRTYVANRDSITVYGPSWAGGDLAPTQRLTGAATGLSRPSSIVFDDQNLMYVANSGASTVATFDMDWPGTSSAPLSTLSGHSSRLSLPAALLLSDDGSIIVSNLGSDTVTAYSPSRLQVTLTEANGASYPLVSPTRNPSVQLSAQRVTVKAASSLGTAIRVTSLSPRVCVGEGIGTTTIELIRPGNCVIQAQVTLSEPWSVSPILTRTFSVIPSSQALEIPALPESLLSTGWVRVQVRSTSGLPVTIWSATPSTCMPSFAFGHRVKLLAPGPCTLQLYQPGNEFWQAALGTVSFPIVSARITATCERKSEADGTYIACLGRSEGLPAGTRLDAFTREPQRGSWNRAPDAGLPVLSGTGEFAWRFKVGGQRSLSVYFSTGDTRSRSVTVKLR